MIRTEQDVKTAAEMYEARRAAKYLLGNGYEKSLRPYRDLIARVMKQKQLSVVQAALDIGTHIPPVDAVPLMCLLAAVVEMLEEGTPLNAGRQSVSHHGDGERASSLSSSSSKDLP